MHGQLAGGFMGAGRGGQAFAVAQVLLKALGVQPRLQARQFLKGLGTRHGPQRRIESGAIAQIDLQAFEQAQAVGVLADHAGQQRRLAEQQLPQVVACIAMVTLQQGGQLIARLRPSCKSTAGLPSSRNWRAWP
jgi:hypothetical protein